MKIKPKLVDHSLFKKPSPVKPKRLEPPKLSTSSSINTSFYINAIGLLILIIGSLCLYQRFIDRNTIEIEKQNVILDFYQTVNQQL